MTDEKMIVSLRTPPPSEPTPAPSVPPRRRRRSSTRKFFLIGILVVAVLLGGWRYLSTRNTHSENQNGGVVASSTNLTNALSSAKAAQIASIVTKVGALIDLPGDETPTIATVTDPSKLQDQVFFAHAKTGDIVLIYTGAREAYLYDPNRNKLVEVAPITTGTP